jgi:hypothetical protein
MKKAFLFVGSKHVVQLVLGPRGLSDAPFLALMFLVGLLIYLGIYVLLPGGRSELIAYWGYLTVLKKGALSLLARIGSGNSSAPPDTGDYGCTSLTIRATD